MITERDSWFHSNACFIRDGVNCLMALKKQQQMGLDLLAALAQGGDNKYDDYIPIDSQLVDTKPILGSSRRHIASDQAMRAGSLFDPKQSQAGTSSVRAQKIVPCATPGNGSQAIPEFPGDAELSDTDDEEHQQKRRRRSAHGRGRRRHLLAPSTARTRVMLSQGRLASQSIKSEEESHGHLGETPLRPPKVESNFEPPNPRLHSNGMTKPLKPIPKFRVDSLHLAALMAVGTSPPSSP